MHIQTEALVLREALYKESDKILTVLTRDEGKMTVRARGARRGGNKLAAASQTLVYSHMTLFEHKTRCTLDESEVLDAFFPLRQDVECLSLALYLAELCEALTDEAPDPAVFSLMLNVCHALSHLRKPPPLVKPAAELRLLSLSGFQPATEICPVCGKAPPESPCLHVSQGFVQCAACREQQEKGRSLPLGRDAWMALRHIVAGNPKRLFSFTLPPGPLALLTAASEAFVLTQLEREFRTLTFHKNLRSYSVLPPMI